LAALETTLARAAATATALKASALAAFEAALAGSAAALRATATLATALAASAAAGVIGASATSAGRLVGRALSQDDRRAGIALEGRRRRAREGGEQGQGGPGEEELGRFHEPIVR
jgi:hypothetical protein